MNHMKQTDRTVIVTGAARGIGFAIANGFIQNGDFVIIADIDGVEANEAARRLGPRAVGYQLDVADEESVREFTNKVISERGTVHVLVNNAGLQHIDKVEDFPTDRWCLLIDVMLTGTFLMTKYTLPYMKNQQYGRIINVSSAHGKMASPYKSAYVSAKHGVVGFTRTIALETATEGITVNTIMPGPVKTELIEKQIGKLAEEDGISEEEAIQKHLLGKQPMKRFIDPSEIAGTAVFLASDSAASITGDAISVSGGI